MVEVWAWIKKWAWAFVAALLSLLALLAGRRPKWMKEKEREIRERDKEITKAQDKFDDVHSDYDEVKADHDEEIKQAEQTPGRPSITDPDDAAGFIDDVLRQRKGK